MASRKREPKELTSGSQGRVAKGLASREKRPVKLIGGGWGKFPENRVSGNEEYEAKGANQRQLGGKPKNRISGNEWDEAKEPNQ